ncbi:GntR family transcriptional regulator (plasmid) [Streptomyces graminifolii]|uniref:GntR family transcriptional regulator n=1 Tax=Streptomyces graminifolii TaxID=1266771 RepID=UPI00405A457F
MTDTETPAERIAGDLALAIHQGSIRADEQLPTQAHLMKAYGVATATASSALAKLQTAGLTRSERGRGTYAVATHRIWNNPILDVMAAAAVCRSLAATTFGKHDTNPTIPVGGDPDWLTEHEHENTRPGRMVDVSALVGIDRHVLRWMSEAFLSAARRLVASGQTDADTHLIEAARAILRDGGRRPENQPGIAHWGGPTPEDEDVVLRIWPERANPSATNAWPF